MIVITRPEVVAVVQHPGVALVSTTYRSCPITGLLALPHGNIAVREAESIAVRRRVP
jgi:hypothetical protein